MRFNTFADLANGATDFLSVLIPIVFLLCFLAFFWNGSRFILTDGDSKDFDKRKNWLIYGVIALLAATTLGGFVYLLQNLFFLTAPDGMGSVGAEPQYSEPLYSEPTFSSPFFTE